MFKIKLLIGAIGILSYLSGCRAVQPRTLHTAIDKTVKKEKTLLSGAIQDTTNNIVKDDPPRSDSIIGERQRVLPLRYYMDELARRQASIEQRLDSIADDISSIKEKLAEEQRYLSYKQATVNQATVDLQDTTLRTGKDYELGAGERKYNNLPPLTKNSGIILPDNSGELNQTNATHRNKSERKNLPLRRTVFSDKDSIVRNNRLSQFVVQKKTDLLKDKRIFDSAMVAFRSARYNDAIARLTVLLEQDPTQKGEYLYWRALAYYMQQKMDDALHDIQQSWQLLRQSRSVRLPDIMYLLSELTAQRGDVEEAQTLLRTLLERYPGSDAALLARRKLHQLIANKK